MHDSSSDCLNTTTTSSTTTTTTTTTTTATTATTRILSIQSHVVSGYVGNKSAVFPLQLLGFDVDVINSVHFSNHTGYSNGFEGDILKGYQLISLLDGLQRNDLLYDIGHVLTGYIGSESFLLAVVDVIHKLRNLNDNNNNNDNNQDNCTNLDDTHNNNKNNKNFTLHNNNNNNKHFPRKVRYVCDPVLGDQGKFYVPERLVQVYKEKLIPLADVLTPNQFEVEQLTGIATKTMDDAIKACKILHDIGPTIVFITSMIFDSNKESDNESDDKLNKSYVSTETNEDKVKQQQEQQPPKLTILASSSLCCHCCCGQIDETTTITQAREQQAIWQIDCPILPGQFTGTGDLTAALLLAHTADMYNDCGSSSSPSQGYECSCHCSNKIIPQAMEKVINTMFATLQRTNDLALHSGTTSSVKCRELKLIQSKDIIENPPNTFKAVRIR